MKKQPGKDIWICGGAETARQLIENNLIDLYHLAIIPVFLGSGTRLFESTGKAIKLTMAGIKEYNGIVEMMYKRR